MRPAQPDSSILLNLQFVIIRPLSIRGQTTMSTDWHTSRSNPLNQNAPWSWEKRGTCWRFQSSAPWVLLCWVVPGSRRRWSPAVSLASCHLQGLWTDRWSADVPKTLTVNINLHGYRFTTSFNETLRKYIPTIFYKHFIEREYVINNSTTCISKIWYFWVPSCCPKKWPIYLIMSWKVTEHFEGLCVTYWSI